MEEMIKHHMVSNKNNTCLVSKKGDIYSRACVYWYQQRPFIKEFLNDPLVPPDTNIVEQAIRPITVFRKNANWKATISYMEDLCMLYSLFMSAKKKTVLMMYTAGFEPIAEICISTALRSNGQPTSKKANL